MNTEVNASDVIDLLSRRIAELTVELDTYKVAVSQLENAMQRTASISEIFEIKVASLKNVVVTLKNQILELGGEPCPCADDVLNDAYLH